MRQLAAEPERNTDGDSLDPPLREGRGTPPHARAASVREVTKCRWGRVPYGSTSDADNESLITVLMIPSSPGMEVRDTWPAFKSNVINGFLTSPIVIALNPGMTLSVLRYYESS